LSGQKEIKWSEQSPSSMLHISQNALPKLKMSMRSTKVKIMPDPSFVF